MSSVLTDKIISSSSPLHEVNTKFISHLHGKKTIKEEKNKGQKYKGKLWQETKNALGIGC
jgi:hypothetical protein